MWVFIRGNMVNLKQIFLIRLTLRETTYSGKTKDITIVDTKRVDEIFAKSPNSVLKIWINGVELANYKVKDIPEFYEDWKKVMLAVKLDQLTTDL